MNKKRWSVKELEILDKNYCKSSIEDMQKLLSGRSKDAIQWKASQLGLLIRDGKQIKADQKIIVNITKRHAAYLKGVRNHSRIIRDALDDYIEKHKK